MQGRTRQVLEILLPSLAELLPPTSFLALAATNTALDVGTPVIIRALAEHLPELKVPAVARRVAEASHPLREIKRVALAARKLKQEPSYPESVDATLPYTCVATITTLDGERIVETGTLEMVDIDEQCDFTEMRIRLSEANVVDHLSFDYFSGPVDPPADAFWSSRCENRCHVRITMVRDQDGAVLVLYDGSTCISLLYPWEGLWWFEQETGAMQSFNVPTKEQIMEWPWDLKTKISTDVLLVSRASTRISDDSYGCLGHQLAMRIWMKQEPENDNSDPRRDHQYYNRFAAPNQACFVRYLNYIGDWR